MDEPQRLMAWRFISLKDQWDRFVADIPPGEPPVLSKRHFNQWGEAYLDTDRESRTRTPAAVKTPSGAFQDIYDAWAGELAYDPGLVRAPVVIIRGEWDRMSSEEDGKWLFDALKASPLRASLPSAAAPTSYIWRKTASPCIARRRRSLPATRRLPAMDGKPV